MGKALRPRRLLFLLLMILGVICFLFPQTALAADGVYGWTKTVGETGSDAGYSLNLDANGNLFITGNFSSTVDFDPSSGTDNHTAAGSTDIFVSKYNADGSYGWTKTVGGTGYDGSNSLSLDDNGNLFITGWFSSTVDFDPSSGTDNRTSAGGYDIFVSKYNADGSYGWTKTVGGTGSDTGKSLSLDANGNIFITGYFQSTFDFDPSSGTDNHTVVGGSDIFVSKYNADGSYGWTKTVGGTGTDAGSSLSLDTNGNIFITGYFQSTFDFDPSSGTDNRTAAGSFDVFVSKYNTDGSYGWTKTVGGTGGDTNGGYLNFDDNGNLFIAGSFKSTFDFDPSSGTDNRTSAGSYDIFVSKYNADGSYGWTKTVGSTGDDQDWSLNLDDNGNIFITGYFSSTVDFDPSSGTDNHTAAGGSDIFVSKYNADGSYGWTKTVGGTGSDRGQSVDTNGNIFITGYFSSTVDFDPSSGTDNRTAAGSTDIFVSKYIDDITAPSPFDLISPGHLEYTSDSRPTFKWKAASTLDTGSGISHYKFEVLYEKGGGFIVDGIPSSGTSDNETEKYIIKYEGFSDSDNTNNYISLQTKSSSSWGECGGELKSGTNNWSVRAIDRAGNERAESRIVYLGTSPYITSTPTPTPTPTPVRRMIPISTVTPTSVITPTPVMTPTPTPTSPFIPPLLSRLGTKILEIKILKEEKILAETEEEKEKVREEGHAVQVRVLDNQGRPLKGIKVILHSEPRETYTSEEGIAFFTQVESGEHKVLIVYGNQEAEQKLNLQGEVLEFHYDLEVKEVRSILTPQVLIISGFFFLFIALLLFLFFKKKLPFVS